MNKIKSAIGSLLDSISDLSVSKFLAFTFLAAPLFYEAIHFQSLSWSKISMLAIFIITGLRIFLSNWEVEEAPTYKFIITDNTSTLVKSEWLLRASWLFLVYMFPVLLVHKDEQILNIVIPILLGLLFLLLMIWDFQFQRFIEIKKQSLANGEFDKYFSRDKKTFFEVIAMAFKKSAWKWEIEKFEHKVILWKWLEIVNFLFILFYGIIAIFSNEKVIENFSTVFIFITLLTFLLEFFANINDYWKRLLWCFITSLLVSFVLLGLNSLLKHEAKAQTINLTPKIDTVSSGYIIHVDSIIKIDTCKRTK